MRPIRITSIGILSVLLGIAAPAYAQHDQQGQKQDRPEQKQSGNEQAKPEKQHAQQQQHTQQKQHAQQLQEPQHAQQKQHAQQQQEPQHAQQKQHAQQQQGPQHAQQKQHAQQQQEPQHAQQKQHVEQSAWQQHRSQHWQSDHRTWQQRGGYHGYRIPDDRFRGYFGPSHGFRIVGLPFLVVGGYPRFQYQGYWISTLDPWPDYWGNNWYDDDDVYVSYVDNGYYLYNRRFPTAGIAISISL